MNDFLFSEVLVCPCCWCLVQSPWHQASGFVYHVIFFGTFSASSLSFSFLLKKSLVLQNSFHWSLVLQFKMKRKGVHCSLLFPTCFACSGCHKKVRRDNRLGRVEQSFRISVAKSYSCCFSKLRVVPVTSQMENPTAECHSEKS